MDFNDMKTNPEPREAICKCICHKLAKGTQGVLNCNECGVVEWKHTNPSPKPEKCICKEVQENVIRVEYACPVHGSKPEVSEESWKKPLFDLIYKYNRGELDTNLPFEEDGKPAFVITSDMTKELESFIRQLLKQELAQANKSLLEEVERMTESTFTSDHTLSNIKYVKKQDIINLIQKKKQK